MQRSVCVCVCVCVCVRACVCVHVCMCIYLYALTHKLLHVINEVPHVHILTIFDNGIPQKILRVQVEALGHVLHKVEDEDKDDKDNLHQQQDCQQPVILQQHQQQQT